jgi:UTP--glucose-1-phosphate uridylyltransferase
MVKKAVIPAAGFGTRMLPASKTVPKEMIALVDKPAISYIIKEAVDSGIEDILIISSRGKSAMEEYFDPAFELEQKLLAANREKDLLELKKMTEMANIHFIHQKEQKGLGHAIYCAKTFTGDQPFAVLLGDDIIYSDKSPATAQLCSAYDKYAGTVLGVQYIDDQNISKYGCIKPFAMEKDIFRVDDMIEKPQLSQKLSNYAALGRYILTKDIYGAIENTSVGHGGEIQLTDAIKKLIIQKNVFAINFYGKRYDTGNKLGYMKACVEYALRHDEIGNDFLNYLKELLVGL